MGGSCGDGETLTSLRKIFVALLLLIRGDDSILHSLLDPKKNMCGAWWAVGACDATYLLKFQDVD